MSRWTIHLTELLQGKREARKGSIVSGLVSGRLAQTPSAYRGGGIIGNQMAPWSTI